MRFGFAPMADDDDAEIVDLGTGMAVVDEVEVDDDPGPLAYIAVQIGGRLMEWRIR